MSQALRRARRRPQARGGLLSGGQGPSMAFAPRALRPGGNRRTLRRAGGSRSLLAPCWAWRLSVSWVRNNTSRICSAVSPVASAVLALPQPLQLVHHRGGQADRAPAIHQGAADAVTDPPGGVRGKRGVLTSGADHHFFLHLQQLPPFLHLARMCRLSASQRPRRGRFCGADIGGRMGKVG